MPLLTAFASLSVVGMRKKIAAAVVEPEVASLVATGGTVTEITEGGVDYKVHTFTSSGTFEVVSGNANVEYLVVAGGGGGGGDISGGGGAGGYRSSVVGESSGGGATAESKLAVTPGAYAITIGAGGAGATAGATRGTEGTRGNDGSPSSIGTLVTTIGGGGGGAYGAPTSDLKNGRSGGSGGGAGAPGDGSGDGGTAAVIEGYAGGLGVLTNGFYKGGGGGGAGAVGAAPAAEPTGGNGGVGVSSSITGTSIFRAGGGGGASYKNAAGAVSGTGGNGGGGRGGASNGGTITTAVVSGTVNTGGGGGGGAWQGTSTAGGAGGSGIVIIRYPVGVVESEPVVEAGFGPVATNFIDTFSGTKKYIDITNGSDSNNGDTDAAAYQTLAYAQAQTAAISTAVMYVIKPGVYDLTPVVVQAAYPQSAGFSDGNLPRTFFCAAGQVIFQWTANSAEREAAMVHLQNANSAVYGAILKRNNVNKTTSYSTAMFHGTSTPSNGDFYNCVFQETNANGIWSLQYDNYVQVTNTVNNCSFYTVQNGLNDWTGSAGLVLNNCAFRYAPGTTSATQNSTVTVQTMDATTYELATNNSTHGVYSGTYAWGTDMWVPTTPATLEYLVVAGGASGGSYGGGGGAGGLLQGSMIKSAGDVHTFTVGAGGAAHAVNGGSGINGSNSVALGLTAIGGGGGGNNAADLANATGLPGGSGGGASQQNYTGGAPGGAGTSGQGNRGGNTTTPWGGQRSRGGGGAGAAGADGTGASVGPGGAGAYSSITGTNTAYAGGGGGYNFGSAEKASGGVGGGGASGASGSIQGTSGTANTGGGGGSGGPNCGAGGSGIIILKYPDTLTLTIGAGLTSTTTASSGYKITTFTAGTGNVTF